MHGPIDEVSLPFPTAGDDAHRGPNDWRELSQLPHSSAEALAAVAAFGRAFPGASAEALLGGRATEGRLRERAPGTVFLHLSTHGWFRHDLVSDYALHPSAGRRSIDLQLGLFRSRTPREVAIGSVPLVLCGLAFAGANDLSERERGNGILTGEEALESSTLANPYYATALVKAYNDWMINEAINEAENGG